LWKVLEILLLIFLPLVWGLGVEFAFERIRRRRSAVRDAEANGGPNDWTI
jgi:hypothetical protein